jgi:hypothetical protein
MQFSAPCGLKKRPSGREFRGRLCQEEGRPGDRNYFSCLWIYFVDSVAAVW